MIDIQQTPAQYQLVSVHDLRIWDWDREEYLPLEKGEGNICERCGREHAKVYTVENLTTGTRHLVGSTCSRKMFGWEPTADELRAATKTARTEAKRLAYEKYLKEIAQPLADKILAMPVPPIRLTETHTFDKRVYGCSYAPRHDFTCGDVTMGLVTDRLDSRDRVMFMNAWREKRIKEIVIEQTGDRFSKRGGKLSDALGTLVLSAEWME